MTQPNHAQAPEGADGHCRNRRRLSGGRRAWVRPFRRANQAISHSLWLIGRTLLAVGAAERGVQQHPIRTSREIHEATARLTAASRWLHRAVRDLAKTNACIARDPENSLEVPDLLLDTTEAWLYAAEWLQEVAGNVFGRHANILRGLETGELVPEQPAERRPRIVLAPRPALRAFLRLRQPRVTDRITPILRRRRRTPRPAAIRVPQRSLLGRAPPLLSICLL